MTYSKYYLASTLSNKAAVANLSALLDAHGFDCTYRWWELHGEVGMDRYPEIAHNELVGALACDFFVLLCPGKFGAHTELGLAMADPLRKIFIAGHRDHMVKRDDGYYPSIFYYHPNVRRIMEETPVRIVQEIRQNLGVLGL